MPHEPTIERQDVLLKDTLGGHDMVAVSRYEAPMGPDGEIANDPFKTMDLANAQWMANILLKHYPGHFWNCKHDGHQKMAYFNIPILMGINKYWAINLVTDPLSEGLLMRAGGELLERYGLKRGRFQLDPFLDAREKHSALVMPFRKVPG